MATDTEHVKAEIRNLDRSEPSVECLFNPKEYAIAKSNAWAAKTAKGSNVPQMEFGGGEPSTLTLQLFFDTFEKGRDVRKAYTDRIWNLMLIDDTLTDHTTQKGRPPRVMFQWGKAWSFEAVIKSITQRFTLFLKNGTPVRATLDVVFQQVKDDKYRPAQNPTSGGIGGERHWTVREGDTLTTIAHQVYGDASHWRPIADANRLTQVRRLPTGIQLAIPTRG
jgi:hypothetical protein